MLVRLCHVFPCGIDVAVGGEDLVPDDVQLLALFMHEHSGLLDEVMDVHDALSDDVDLLVALVHQLALHLELDLLLLLLLAMAVVAGRLALLVREAAPGGNVGFGWLGLRED